MQVARPREGTIDAIVEFIQAMAVDFGIGAGKFDASA